MNQRIPQKPQDRAVKPTFYKGGRNEPRSQKVRPTPPPKPPAKKPAK